MQFRPTLTAACCAAALAATLSLATRADAPPVRGAIEAFLVTDAGEADESLVPADVARPGEIMEFRIAFTNGGDEAVQGIQVVDPIPANTRFIGDSHDADVAASFAVSIDGGDSFEPEPVTRIETQADGSQKEVVISPSDYTHVRWVAEEALAAGGGTQRFAYRVAVN